MIFGILSPFEIGCELFIIQQNNGSVSLMSAHSLYVSVSHFRLLATFISSGLWLQHPDLNAMNYKIYIEIQQRSAPKNS